MLTGVPTAAHSGRADATADITTVLGGTAPLLRAVVRSSDAVAMECRAKGLLAQSWSSSWKGWSRSGVPLPEGHTPQRVLGSAPALADDYVRVIEQVLLRLNELEANPGAA